LLVGLLEEFEKKKTMIVIIDYANVSQILNHFLHYIFIQYFSHLYNINVLQLLRIWLEHHYYSNEY
jgi:hypothetical protein